jgi:hypothetical protein
MKAALLALLIAVAHAEQPIRVSLSRARPAAPAGGKLGAAFGALWGREAAVASANDEGVVPLLNYMDAQVCMYVIPTLQRSWRAAPPLLKFPLQHAPPVAGGSGGPVRPFVGPSACRAPSLNPS